MSILQHHTNTKMFLGQFYTTNSDYILQGLSLPNNCEIIEPFVGQGDLVNWVKKNIKPTKIEAYDIDPKIDCDDVRDTILFPPNYKGKWIVTNPPFLARNKNKDKTIYDTYGVDDLYKASILTLINGECEGGILIIPLNFLCGEESKTRDLFLSNYKIIRLNIFEEKVFDDTSYTVCAFSFVKMKSINQEVETIIYPIKKNMKLFLDKKYGFRIGGDILTKKNSLKLGRLLEGQIPSTNLKLYAVDSGTPEGKIRLIVDENHYFGKDTDRVFCSITSLDVILNENEICDKFNQKLAEYRDKYHSLFLTNYRESTKHYSRKRISFKQAFSLLNEIISNP